MKCVENVFALADNLLINDVGFTPSIQVTTEIELIHRMEY